MSISALSSSSSSLNVTSTKSPSIAYPGKSGTWEGGWAQAYGIHAYSLDLTTQTPDSFLGEIRIICCKSGDVDFRLSVKNQELGGISHDQLKFEKYLEDNDLSGRNQMNRWVNTYQFSTPEERAKIYEILVRKNEFPKDILDTMTILAKTTDWKKEEFPPIESSSTTQEETTTQDCSDGIFW